MHTHAHLRSYTIGDKKLMKLKRFVSHLMRGIRCTKLELSELAGSEGVGDQRALSFDFANGYDGRHFQNLLKKNMANIRQEMDKDEESQHYHIHSRTIGEAYDRYHGGDREWGGPLRNKTN